MTIEVKSLKDAITPYTKQQKEQDLFLYGEHFRIEIEGKKYRVDPLSIIIVRNKKQTKPRGVSDAGKCL